MGMGGYPMGPGQGPSDGCGGPGPQCPQGFNPWAWMGMDPSNKGKGQAGKGKGQGCEKKKGQKAEKEQTQMETDATSGIKEKEQTEKPVQMVGTWLLCNKCTLHKTTGF